MDIKQLIGDYDVFVSLVDSTLIEMGIDESEIVMIDHLCYRVESIEEYKTMKAQLVHFGTIIGEIMINGRLIATYDLETPIQTTKWRIPYIELPAPKHDSFYSSGLEHAEIVVNGSLEKFKKRHNNLRFKDSNNSKKINPELTLIDTPVGIKFHELQLGAVVRIEQAMNVV